MLRHKNSVLSLLFCASVLLYACSSEETSAEINTAAATTQESASNLRLTNTDDKEEQAKKLAELNLGLTKVFADANATIRATIDPVDNVNLTNVLRNSYVKIYGQYADTSIFDDWAQNFQALSDKAEKSPYAAARITSIIGISNSPEEAVRLMNDEIENNVQLTFEDKVDFLTMTHTISFISTNNQFLQVYAQKPKKVTPKPPTSWWDDWGKCASSIVGGAVTGATTLGLAGAAVGTVTLPVVGTVAGGTVGAVGGGIGGALTGAVAGC